MTDSEVPAPVDEARSRRDIAFEESARDTIDAHVASDTSVEKGGVLVGTVDEETGRVFVSAAIPAHRATSAAATLTFTHEAWDEVNAVLAEDYEGLRMVGWYHSHPRFGIFLSEYDLFIQSNFFSAPWQVAYVADPVAGTSGFFGWENGSVVRYPVWTLIARGGAKSVREPDRGRPPGPTTPTLSVPVDRAPAQGNLEQQRPKRTDPPWMAIAGVAFVVAVAIVIVLIALAPGPSKPKAAKLDKSQPASVRPGTPPPTSSTGPITIRGEGTAATDLFETWKWSPSAEGGVYTVIITFRSATPSSDLTKTGVVSSCAPPGLVALVPVNLAAKVPASDDASISGADGDCALGIFKPQTGLTPNRKFVFLFTPDATGGSIANPGAPGDPHYSPTTTSGAPPTTRSPLPVVTSSQPS
jgi:proteasome lid subunit RPN8/RPN11